MHSVVYIWHSQIHSDTDVSIMPWYNCVTGQCTYFTIRTEACSETCKTIKKNVTLKCYGNTYQHLIGILIYKLALIHVLSGHREGDNPLPEPTIHGKWVCVRFTVCSKRELSDLIGLCGFGYHGVNIPRVLSVSPKGYFTSLSCCYNF